MAKLRTGNLDFDNEEVFPQVSLDCVIFGFHAGSLKVLLLKWKSSGYWSLPGGLLRQIEDIDDAAVRILQERTGLIEIFLQQFYTFGKRERYNKQVLSDKLSYIIDPKSWYDRTISIGYYALVDYAAVFPNPDEFTEECRWWDLAEIPDLLFDHNEILKKALQSLRLGLSHQPVGYNLLSHKFTMPEMMRMYEAILGRKVDPRNFQKKIIHSGIVIKLNEVRKGLAHKSPFLYKFDKDKYREVLEEGGLFII
jgi:8-oxo-dGTP diphosphatase